MQIKVKKIARLLASFVLAILMQSESNAQSECSTPRISLQIIELNNRVCAYPGASCGSLRIQFKNNGDVPVQLQFAGTYATGGFQFLQHRGLTPVPSYYVQPPGHPSYGAAFSTFDYTWKTGESGFEVESGIYDVSQPSTMLDPGQYFAFYVPIKVPVKPDKYRLFAHFDSRNLLEQVNTSGATLDCSRLGCFDANAEATVVIPERPETVGKNQSQQAQEPATIDKQLQNKRP